jgi:hypothetical protein
MTCVFQGRGLLAIDDEDMKRRLHSEDWASHAFSSDLESGLPLGFGIWDLGFDRISRASSIASRSVVIAPSNCFSYTCFRISPTWLEVHFLRQAAERAVADDRRLVEHPGLEGLGDEAHHLPAHVEAVDGVDVQAVEDTPRWLDAGLLVPRRSNLPVDERRGRRLSACRAGGLVSASA